MGPRQSRSDHHLLEQQRLAGGLVTFSFVYILFLFYGIALIANSMPLHKKNTLRSQT